MASAARNGLITRQTTGAAVSRRPEDCETEVLAYGNPTCWKAEPSASNGVHILNDASGEFAGRDFGRVLHLTRKVVSDVTLVDGHFVGFGD